MSSTFHALPLTSGESFLLETEHKNQKYAVLVDAGGKTGQGKKSHPLVDSISQVAGGLQKINIAICTHQDKDHAEGFVDFADYWYRLGGSISEFWLPGRWSATVPEILTSPNRFLSKLISGSLEATDLMLANHARDANDWSEEYDVISDLLPYEYVSEHISKDFSHLGLSDDGPLLQDHPWSLEVDADQHTRDELLSNAVGLHIEELEQLRNRFGSQLDDPTWTVVNFPRNNTTGVWLAARVFGKAVKIAMSIRSILMSAITYGIPIRWFDFGLFQCHDRTSGGIPGFLVPVNAVEHRLPPPSRSISPLTLWACLNLSPQNVESLVFLRRETSSEPAVLFLGDSRLSFGLNRPTRDFRMPTNPPTRKSVLTAPHHGAKVNDHAYDVIKKWLPGGSDPIYIRNGGHHKQTLGAYRGMPIKSCAQCRQCRGVGWNQQVTLGTNGGNWRWGPSQGNPC